MHTHLYTVVGLITGSYSCGSGLQFPSRQRKPIRSQIQGSLGLLLLDGNSSNDIFTVPCKEFSIAHRYNALFCNLAAQSIVCCDDSSVVT